VSSFVYEWDAAGVKTGRNRPQIKKNKPSPHPRKQNPNKVNVLLGFEDGGG
jgi:hypothetical protein